MWKGEHSTALLGSAGRVAECLCYDCTEKDILVCEYTTQGSHRADLVLVPRTIPPTGLNGLLSNSR